MSYELTGLEGKIAVVTGAGRMRSIGRSIALELAKAGCDVVITGSGRSPDAFPMTKRKPAGAILSRWPRRFARLAGVRCR